MYSNYGLYGVRSTSSVLPSVHAVLRSRCPGMQRLSWCLLLLPHPLSRWKRWLPLLIRSIYIRILPRHARLQGVIEWGNPYIYRLWPHCYSPQRNFRVLCPPYGNTCKGPPVLRTALGRRAGHRKNQANKIRQAGSSSTRNTLPSKPLTSEQSSEQRVVHQDSCSVVRGTP